jgi:thymidine kinase
MSGKLTVFYGCMFSGKTGSMITYISALNLKRDEFIVIKPSVDIRSGKATITTHDGRSHDCIIYEKDMELADHVTQFTRLIAIDEAQFFDKTFFSQLKRMLGKGIHVVAAGLDMDYKARPFGLMPSVIDLADEKNHLKAKCAVCGSEATHTYRKTPNNVLVLIGHSDHYEPRCETCYLS